MSEHYGTDPMLECECFLHRRIRELQAEVMEWKNRWVLKDIQVNNIITEHNAERDRARAEVERLKDHHETSFTTTWAEQTEGGGRESGAEGTESPARSGGMAESRAAADPAARKEASP